jgi:tripartite-type tricarboxylate transporter receptor subunit TctC
MLRIVVMAFLVFTTWSGFAADASAQTYPQRAVKFILPFGPASGTDITARLVADRLSARWGKAAIIENRPGGDGLVAINAFVAANDDHTLLWVPVGTFAVHPYEKDKLPYKAERDLVPIANVSSLFLAVTVSNALNVGSLRELVELLRSNPDKYNWAAANGNADFLMSGFLKNNGLQIAKTPYRDILQAPNDLAENRIQLLSSSLAIVTPLMQAGKVKVLAVTGRKRAPSAPDVPTVREAGFPALEMESIGGIFGPRGMPLALREQIAADVRAAVAGNEDIASKLAATGQAVDLRGPAEFATGIKELHEQLAGIAKVLGLKAAAQ